MSARAAAVATALLAVAFAGCVSIPTSEDAVGSEATGAAAGLPLLDLRGTNCFEGGGHSVHPIMFNPLPEPWYPADVLADVGPQYAYSEVPDPTKPIPEEGNTMGNIHSTILCESWTFRGEDKPGLIFGYVGMKIETPPFGTPGPTHEYVVTVVATNDEDVHAALMDAGFHAMLSTATVEDTAGVLRIRMSTDHNGEYDSIFKPKEFGDMQVPWMRVWFQRENADGTYSPIALDMTNTGGTHHVADGQGYFSHVGTHHHGPQGGAYGQTAAVLWTGHDKVFSWGPQPEGVTISGYYDH